VEIENMQVALRFKDFISGSGVVDTEAVDVQGMSFLMMVLEVYAFSGTQVSAVLYTSDDLESWDTVGSPLTATGTGSHRLPFQINNFNYGRYVRVRVAASTATVTYSVWINTYTNG
jgi:hypothetical protein